MQRKQQQHTCIKPLDNLAECQQNFEEESQSIVN